jgi:hypothetical protein
MMFPVNSTEPSSPRYETILSAPAERIPLVMTNVIRWRDLRLRMFSLSDHKE